VNTTGPKERERAFDLIEDTVQAHVHDNLHSTKSVGKRRTFVALKRGDAHTDHDVREQSGTTNWRIMAQSFDVRDIWSRRLAACGLTVETPTVKNRCKPLEIFESRRRSGRAVPGLTGGGNNGEPPTKKETGAIASSLRGIPLALPFASPAGLAASPVRAASLFASILGLHDCRRSWSQGQQIRHWCFSSKPSDCFGIAPGLGDSWSQHKRNRNSTSKSDKGVEASITEAWRWYRGGASKSRRHTRNQRQP